MKMMVPHDCHALLEKKTIVTKATSLAIRVYLCCNVDEQVRTNVKHNDESNVLFMWRKKRVIGNYWQCFSLVVFTFCFYK